jgi:hypothetical protein
MDAFGLDDDHPDDMSGRSAGGWLRLTRWVAAVLAIGFLAFAGSWWVEGGRWVRVETPSMGSVAPIGTLLWIKPVAFDKLKVGDFITFHPPGDKNTTYSHRVYKIDADHTIQTKGVIPAPDPWRLTGADVVGEVKMRWWGFGWIVRAAPILLIGSLLTGGALSLVRTQWRLPVGLVLGSLVLTIAITVYRPFVNAEQVAFAPVRSGGATATYVGTGLLPIRLQAHDGRSVVISDGHLGTVHVSTADSGHKLRVNLKPAIPWMFWILLVLFCLVPAIASSASSVFDSRRAAATGQA